MSRKVALKVSRRYKIRRSGLAGILIFTGLWGCTAAPTPEPPSLLLPANNQWQEVTLNENSMPEYSEHCRVKPQRAICQLIEDIASSVRFQSTSPDLQVESTFSLEEAIEPILNDKLRLSVTTYIDDTGDELLDVWLAKRRTLTVIRFLSDRGVPLAWLRPREPVNQPDGESGFNEQKTARQIELRILSN